MKVFASALIAVMGLVTAVSCGKKEDEKKAYSGSGGSCKMDILGDGTSIMCTDYNYTGTLKKDPAADMKAEVKKECTATAPMTATYAETACVSTGTKGTCSLTATETSNGESVAMTGTIYFTGTAMTVDTAKQSCTAAGGTYKD